MQAGYNQLPPSFLLFDELEALGLTITAAAEKIGITRKHLSNIIHGRAGITPVVALAIEQHIGGKAEVWLAMQGSYDLWKLRQSQIVHNDSDDNEHIDFEVTNYIYDPVKVAKLATARA